MSFTLTVGQEGPCSTATVVWSVDGNTYFFRSDNNFLAWISTIFTVADAVAGAGGVANPLILPNNTNAKGYSLNTLDNTGVGGAINLSGSEEGTGEGGVIELTGYYDNSAGSIVANGGEALNCPAGSINLSGGLVPDAPGGNINLSGGGARGGNIDLSGGGGQGGDIFLVGRNGSNAGSLFLSAGDVGGGAGGSIAMVGNLGHNAGSINLSANERDGGSIDLSSVDGIGGSIISIGYKGDGGSLNMSGSQNGISGGDISTFSTNDSPGGYINTSGGAGADGNDGGYINTKGGNSDQAKGGSINLSADTVNGGSINLSNGGGSIDLRTTGSIQFGVDGTRTTVQGTATANRTQTFPDESGTIAVIRIASPNLDFPSIAGNGRATLNVTVASAEVGDAVLAVCTSARTGNFQQIIFNGFVVSANTVSVVAVNTYGSALDLPPLDFKIIVFKGI